MTQPENFTSAQASDPATPGQVLADIAALRPDLRAAVASNPSTYPGLIDWLKSLGEPAVDAAIAAREAAPAPTQQMPVQPPTPQGVQAPPAPQWAQQGQQPAFGGPPAGMPPQGMPPQGMPPQGMPPQGMPPQGMPPQGMPPQGMPPQGGLQYGAPPAKSSNKGLWIVLIILGVIVLLGVLGVILAKTVFDKAVDSVDEITNVFDGGNYGDDAELDALWDSCEDGDMAACDDLYLSSPFDSEYELFGDTCGERKEAGTDEFCVVTFGEDTDADTDADTDTDSDSDSGEPFTYGDDPELDALWDQCDGGDGQACDDLYMSSPFDSEYEDFGDTCGGRVPEGAFSCVGK